MNQKSLTSLHQILGLTAFTLQYLHVKASVDHGRTYVQPNDDSVRDHQPVHHNHYQRPLKKMVQYLQQTPESDAPTIDIFTALRARSDIFVDKSLFLRNILSEEEPYSLHPSALLRPRRTGKSINLRMLQKFLEIEVDENGIQVPSEGRVNRKLFTGGKLVLDDGTTKILGALKVIEHEDVMRLHGSSPVILLNMTDITGNTFKEMETAIIRQISVTINQHSYLKVYYDASNDTSLQGKIQKIDVNRIFNAMQPSEETPTDLPHTLMTLAEVVSKHFNKSVYILIDEYERPLINAHAKFGKKSFEFYEVRKLLKNMYQLVFQNNEYVRRGILTGTLPLQLSDYYGGFNNVIEYSVLDEKCSEYFGYTEEEVDRLLTAFPSQNPPSTFKLWYNGYNVNKRVIYNTHSVNQYIASGGLLNNYWLDNVGGTSLMHSMLATNSTGTRLRFLFKNKQCLSERLEVFIDLENISKPTLFDILVFEGYLTAICGEEDSNTFRPIFHLTIPNEEMRKVFSFRTGSGTS